MIKKIIKKLIISFKRKPKKTYAKKIYKDGYVYYYDLINIDYFKEIEKKQKLVRMSYHLKKYLKKNTETIINNI